MTEQQRHVLIIGGGPGGYVAAIRAAQLGLDVALVEREELGGVCLNWGCIPTKALLRSAEVYELMSHAATYGLRAREVGFDAEQVFERSRRIAAQLSQGVRHLLRKHRVSVVKGHARLCGEGRVEVEGEAGRQRIRAANIVIATGARPRSIAPIEPDGDRVWSSKHALMPPAMPRSLLVFGSGAIGIEFASFYRAFGAEVTVVEVVDRILPTEDAEIAALARKAFEKKGIRFLTGAKVVALARTRDAVEATIELAGRVETITAERAISAVGITGNVDELGLDRTAVVVERSHIVTDDWGRTAEPGVHAIGDVAGPPWLAHKASHEGIACIERIAGLGTAHPVDRSRIPCCVYANPQLASVGLTEARAIELGHEVRIGRFPFFGNGKAVALGETEGLVKTVFDARSGELLGAHLVGPEVTELIQGYVIAKTLETTERELMQTVFAHPTLSEALHEATLSAYGHAIHV